MNNEIKMPVSEVLTPDEQLVADFIKTRTKKVLDDIQRLSKEQCDDIAEWSHCFAYLSKTYGYESDETFKWFKYYFREGLIPAAFALPLLVQVYFDGKVDGGFINILSRAMKQEPEDVNASRIEEMKKELADYIGEDGKLTVYRGYFEKPFSCENDASRTIDRAFTFSLEKDVAKHYATCWFPKVSKVYEVKADLSDVAWYTVYDEEKTVILLPQSKGGSWEVVSESEIPESEYQTQVDKKQARASYVALFK